MEGGPFQGDADPNDEFAGASPDMSFFKQMAEPTMQTGPVDLRENVRVSNRTRKKAWNPRFKSHARKSLRVFYDTEVPKTSALDKGGFETPALMGKRDMQRMEKPMAWEIEEDLSKLDPYHGTGKSLYQRDKQRLRLQMRHVRAAYLQEYRAAQQAKKAQIAREYEITTQLKTENLIKKRIRAHFNKIEHEKRHEHQRKLTQMRSAAKAKRRVLFEQQLQHERTYQIEFLLQEASERWLSPDTITEDLFNDNNAMTMTGIYPRGGSGLQSNFLRDGLSSFEAVVEEEPESEEAY